MTIGGTGQKFFGGNGESRTLEINNGAIWNSTSSLFLQGDSIINNNVGSTFDIQEDSTGFIGIFNNIGVNNTFNNAGTFLKSAGDDNFTINILFNNTGTVAANNGILTFSGNYTQSAGDTRLDGGSIVVGSNPLDINAGNVSGFGSIDGDIDNDAGRITPGLSVGDIATLNITGDYSETDFSNIDIEIGGLTNFDILDIDGTATLDGTVNVSLVNGFTPTLGQTFEIITFDSAPDIATNLSFSGLDIGGGLAFAPVFNTNDLSLVVVETAALSVSDVIISEGDNGTTNATFNVTLNGETDAFDVDFATVDGTATVADGDYVANSGTLSFDGTDGQTRTVTVQVNGDNKVELNETFDLVLSNLQGNGTLPVLVSGTGTINNDDSANISIDNVTQSEGNNGTTPFTFTVTLNNEVDTGLSVDFATANGSATVANNDYQATNGTLNFTGNAGETQTITVDVVGDTTVEPDETFVVNLNNLQANGRNIILSDSQGIGTIENDDGANLSITNVNLVEGDNGTQQFVFSVTLSNTISGGATVDFTTADNTATTTDNDYTATSGTLTFSGNAGEVETITVEVNGDNKVELNETFLVNLSNASSGVTIADGQGTGTIVNDDVASLSISDVTLSEGNNGTQLYTFTVTLDEAVDTGFTVDYATANNTASIGDGDYTAVNGTLTFAGNAGETQTITVEVNGDNKVELDETFFVNLSNLQNSGRNVVITDGQGVGTINNDDSASLRINNVTQSEGNSGTTTYTFDVTLDNEVDTGLSLDFDTADDTATVADNDYTANNGTLNFTGNAGEVQTLTVEVNGDTIVEPNEDFLVNLSNLNANGRDVTISEAQGIGTIENDDGAGFSISNATVTEGDNGTQTLTFDVTLNNAVSGGASVDFDTANGTATTADGDYTANSGTLTFVGNAGETQTITVEVNGDNKVELNETILVNLSNAIGADIVDGQGVGTISNDDSASLRINNVTQSEGNSGTTTYTFDVTLDNEVDTGLSLDFDTADDTATVADNDYTANNGTLTFTGNAGEVQTLTIEVNGDTIVEPNEDFLVNLSNLNANGRDVTISDAQGIGTIENDDGAGFSISNATVTEGDNGTQTLTFDVTLNNAVSGGASVDFDTANGTATTADGDYTANSGTLTFAGNAGETQTITVEVNGDNKVELNETILVNLSNAIGADIVDGQGTGTIVNDDSASLSINNVTQSEGNSGTTAYTFDVTLDNEVDTGLSLDFDTADDTATVADNDYTANNGTLTFTGNAGEVQTITIEVNGDTIVEPNEDFLVNLSNLNANGRDVTISDAQGIGTIENDDGAGFSISNATVTEGDNGTQTLTFNVTLNNAVSGGASVDFDTANGTATTADGDYTANSGTLTFVGNAGETQTITVEVNGDNKVELNETILVNLSNAIGADIVDGQGVGTISNDDSASLSINNVTQSEGNSGTTTYTFDVTLDNEVDTGLSLDFDTADDTATVTDNDYTANNGTLNFTGNAGEVQTITIEVNGDTIVEPNEDFLVNLSNLNANGRDVTISEAQGIGTIENDDVPSGPIEINGTAGRDSLMGTAESEIITGFAGSDMLTGMGGADVFAFQNVDDGLDLISDFELGLDVIDLSQLLSNDTDFNPFGQNPLDLGYVQIGSFAGFTTIGIDIDGSAGANSYVRTLAVVQGTGVAPNTLNDPNNFIFASALD
ncbi:Calx-beta domain-containing protein [Cyanothece sp. BG0011]|uniref:beta strand repeat-containing protein n=1 Tax=Cyanothece sp. BG0011 TaxID=2082950 RepID=UPI001300629F|nr:Calx-beta domain-containing protein [Cyanothece sp. BG0011]